MLTPATYDGKREGHIQQDLFGYVDHRKRAAKLLRTWKTQIGMARELNIFDGLARIDGAETVYEAMEQLQARCNDPTLLIFRGSPATYEQCKGARFNAPAKVRAYTPDGRQPNNVQRIGDLLRGIG